MKRALVISGGGSKGAFAGGVAEYLIKEQGIDYDIFVGTSTGSLMIPLLALGEIERLKDAYTSTTQDDVFNSCPFIVEKVNGQVVDTHINHLKIALNFIKGKKTFGESKALRKLISRFFTKKEFERLKATREKVIVTVSNLTRNVVEYKYAKDYSYEDFCDWIWLSCNFVPFMSLAEKNGYEYADGGFGNLIPIQEAIDAGAEAIDVIVLNPRLQITNKPKSTNAFNLLTNAIDFMIHQIAQDDMYLGLLESRHSNIKTRFFHTPHLLTENSFVFEPEQMKAWWREGYEYAFLKFAK
ncbi:patatin-like phospholipase family protein [Portibacter marinus]|uniref:patatin-like phospholipase family protein n=1 Tax=Portibacter marinus TaxID=2898660 RepID=UPI001F3CBC65|nr:patatin-like phospholipase family protein [Portibacter marinus]